MQVSSSSKRLASESNSSPQKRRRIGVNPFLDIEAQVGDEDEEEEELESIGDHLFLPENPEEDTDQEDAGFDQYSPQNNVLTNERPLQDYLAQAIDRTEARILDRENHEEPAPDSGEEIDEEDQKELDNILDDCLRMPAVTDPPLWRVRVHGSQEQYTVLVIHDRLRIFAMQERWEGEPLFAISALMSPSHHGWIAIESYSPRYVTELCRDISSICQPIKVEFVPLEERSAWLPSCTSRPRTTPPAWVRLRRYGAFKEMGLPRYVRKYARDLALVFLDERYPTLDLLFIPRLPVMEENKAGRCRKPMMRRLLHPSLFPEASADGSIDMSFTDSSELYWKPSKPSKLNQVGPVVYKFSDKKIKEYFIPPFAYLVNIPVEALQFGGIMPTVAELDLFFEGLTLADRVRDFKAPAKRFMRWSYHYYHAAPLEQGDLVESFDEGKREFVRGTVTELAFNVALLSKPGTEEIFSVPLAKAQRVYEVGAVVKVTLKSSHHCGEQGWVLSDDGNEAEIFTLIGKETLVVKSWQIEPSEFDTAMFYSNLSLADHVQVRSPVSLHFDRVGRVVQIQGAKVEIQDDQSGERFWMAPWFVMKFEGDPANQKKRWRTNFGRDHYKDLVNQRVVIGGRHHEKGLRVRVREHLGNQLMRVEAESGTRTLDVHVNFLVALNSGSLDLVKYYDRRRELPPVHLPHPPQPVPPESRTATPPPGTPSDETEQVEDAWNPRSQRYIEYEDQLVLRDWVTIPCLNDKRVWVYIRNSHPKPTMGEKGFYAGTLDGERGMIVSVRSADEVEVHLTRAKEVVVVPGHFLFPDRPTSKKQLVVVTMGEHQGRVFVTREGKQVGAFDLVRRGHSKGKPQVVCTIDRNHLARCDALD